MKKVGNLGKWLDDLSIKKCVLLGCVGGILFSIPIVIYILFDAGVF